MSVNENTNRQNKKKFIEALKANLFVVQRAVEETGIARSSHYKWLKEDEDYKREIEEIGEIQFDFVENELLKKIKEGDNQSILFYLKTKGKKFGYGENLDVTTNGKDMSVDIIKIIEVKREDDNGIGD
jgi:hypothetical protein